MSVRLSKRVKLTKGINLNLSKSGFGISFGGKGGRVSLGPRGMRTSVGVPGMRLTKQHSLKEPKARKRQKPSRGGVVAIPAKMGIMVNGRKVHEEAVHVPIKVRRARKRGCGCFTLAVGIAAILLAVLAIFI